MLHVLSSTASQLLQDQSKNRIEHIESFRPGVTWNTRQRCWFGCSSGIKSMSHGLHGVLGAAELCFWGDVQMGLSSWLPAIFGLKAVCHRYNALLNVLDPVVLEFGDRWPTARSGIHIRCCRGPGRSQSADGLDMVGKSDGWRCHVVHSAKIWSKDWKFLWSMNWGWYFKKINSSN